MDQLRSSLADAGIDAGPVNEIIGSATPNDLLIQSRNRHFSSQDIENHHWVDGDPFATAFFNAFSMTFPKGEGFFIKVLKSFQKDAPAKLKHEIGAFIQQEAVHSREHASFNRQIDDAHYDISRLEASVAGVIDTIKGKSKMDQLTAVTCLEHITAILGRELIANPRHLEHADEAPRNMWLWHASEEIEHKGVAYDTWLYATKDWSRWERWSKKSLFMLRISLGFAKNRSKGILDLLEQDGITGFRAKFGLAYYALLGPALFRRTLVPWFKFFLPGFHPWNEDDRYLIQLAESEYEAAIMEQADAPNPVSILSERQKKIRLSKVA